MKITASFDSADTADFAAGDIRRAISPLSSAVAKELPAPSDGMKQNIFSAYNVTSATPTYSMPTYTLAAADIDGNEHSGDYTKSSHIVEVVCRADEYPAVSRIIIGHGGRNISKI